VSKPIGVIFCHVERAGELVFREVVTSLPEDVAAEPALLQAEILACMDTPDDFLECVIATLLILLKEMAFLAVVVETDLFRSEIGSSTVPLRQYLVHHFRLDRVELAPQRGYALLQLRQKGLARLEKALVVH